MAEWGPLAGAAGTGTTITVSTFGDNELLSVEILSHLSIGRGASALIYKGELKLGTRTCTVALKVFPSLLREHEKDMLRRELKAASRAKHNCILPFIGTSNLGGQTIIVTPFMKNGNMLQYLKTRPGADRRALIVQVAEAVCFLHVHVGVVHGDLKCENVLVSDEGNARITDFGLSTMIDKEEDSATTISGIRGSYTLRFAGPEFFLGMEPEDGGNVSQCHARPRSKTPESDVYAFGMLLLQAFTEKAPWHHLLDGAVIWKVYNGEIHPHPGAQATLLGLTNAWWEVCRECWKFNPGFRPTMLQVWTKLKADADLVTRFPNRSLSPPNNHSSSLLHMSLRFCTRMRQAAEHEYGIHSVAWWPSEYGRYVVSGSSDGRIEVWDTRDGAMVEEIRGVRPRDSSPPVLAMAISPDGPQLTYGGADVCCIAYSPDGQRTVSGSRDTTITLRDSFSGRAICEPLRGHAAAVKSVAFSPNGLLFASGSLDSTICVWDAIDGQHLAVLVGHRSAVEAVCWSPDGQFIVSGSLDNTVRIWNAVTFELQVNIHEHSSEIHSVAISPSGRYIASGASDGRIRMSDAETGEPVGMPVKGHELAVRSLAFSPDGKSMASGSDDGTLLIWAVFEH